MLLLFFASLFIVVKGAEKAGILNIVMHYSQLNNTFNSTIVLHGISLISSQIISNVPFVILLVPILKQKQQQTAMAGIGFIINPGR